MENLERNNKKFDVSFASTILNDLIKSVTYLKGFNRSNVPHDFFEKLSILNESLNQLLSSWHLKNSDRTNKIENELWDNFLLKFLFENFIQYSNELSFPHYLPQLYCKICDCKFSCDRGILNLHLRGKIHLDNFDKIRNKPINEDETIWDDCLLKYLFQQFIINKQSIGKLYCKICCVEICKSNLNPHLKSSEHLKNFKKIIDLNFDSTNDSAISKTITESVANISLLDNNLNNHLIKTTTENILPKNLIEKLNEFMERLFNSFSYNKFNPIFCQLCCTCILTMDLNGPPDKLKHELSEFHRSKMNSEEHMNYSWQYCEICRTHFYCNTILFQYHNKHKFHSLMEKIAHSNIPEKNSTNDEQIKNLNKSTSNEDLKNNLKLLMENLLKNSLKFHDENCDFYGYYCSMCHYWTNDKLEWNCHLYNDKSHKDKSHVGANNNFIKICECKIIIICSDDFFKEHVSSLEHIVLKRFLSNKEGKNLSEKNLEKCEASSNVEVVSNTVETIEEEGEEEEEEEKEDEEDDDDDYMFDNFSDTSSVVSCASRKSFYGSRNSLSGRPNDQNQNKYQKRSFRQTVKRNNAVYGIKDIPHKTTYKEIVDACRNLGVVKHVEFVNESSSAANIFVVLGEGDKYEDFLGIYVIVGNRKLRIDNKITLRFTVPRFILDSFNTPPNFFHLMEELYKKCNFASNRSKSAVTKRFFQNGTPLFINVLEYDIKNSSGNIRNVVIIGSKATGLTCEDGGVFDVYVELGDIYFGSKIQDFSIMKSRSAELKSVLIDSHKFTNVKVLGNHPPVIFAYHKQSSVTCRLYFRNGLVVENTSLIQTYLQFDDRIKQLILVVREWAKHTQLNFFLSNYAITWMVLYYLMKGKTAMVHPVTVLRNKNQDSRKMIAGWDCRFCKDISLLPKLECKLSIYELLSGFFLFFSSNNIIRYIHCPLTGEMFSKTKFRKLFLPSPYNKYKYNLEQNLYEGFKITPGICLQDPLELNVNLTVSLVGVNLKKFRFMCSRSVDLLRRMHLR